nr:PREDICTED: UDP-glucuronosyltransferase 2B13-like [Bemisia tabaci]XP_018905858.1 PREDICTED: UDP-glucuronosyltransferase 2B13-like [Bemisia tabaci]XP_018905867.1 PREDICTED: UDP-glucuronosyltransferase 2B13-like [Bemisia tabaci]
MWTHILSLAVILIVDKSSCARILSLMTVPAHSHAYWASNLIEALASRGHQIVALTPESKTSSHPNVTSVYLEGGYDEKVLFEQDLDSIPPIEEPTAMMDFLFNWLADMCRTLLLSPGNKRFMTDYADSHFDLILTDSTGNECFLKYVHLFGYPPVVSVVPYGSPQWVNELVGNFANPAYVPNQFTSFTDRMTFAERLTNLYVNVYCSLFRYFRYLPRNEAIAQEFFGFSEPSVAQLEKHVSLALVNSHFSLRYSESIPPGLVPVAGMHISPAKPLPKDLKNFIEGAEHGVVYFSLGSNLKSDKMSKEKQKAFMDAFARLPQRVLWKFEADSLPELPENVMISKWIPQNDVLAHPNVVLFMTHCGLLSVQESIYHGVPVIGIPLMIDQYINANQIVQKNLGLQIKYSDIKNADQIYQLIHTVTSDSGFKERMDITSENFRDQPIKPLDRAVYWVEYVLRHKSLDHLHPGNLQLSWYQLNLIDVMVFLVISVIITLTLINQLVKRLVKSTGKRKLRAPIKRRLS